MSLPILLEIGVNHIGDPSYCDEYIEGLIAAKPTGVTFQTHSPKTTSTDPQECSTISGRLLPDDYYRAAVLKLKAAGIQVGIASTDYRSISFFADIGVDFFKTLGADITCQPLFEAIAETELPVYISTAYASVSEISSTIDLFHNRDLITLIYTDGIAGALTKTHLRTIEFFRDQFAVPVAYGKHSVGMDILIAALSLCPAAIFAYVKGDRNLKHPDDAHAVPLNEVPLLLSRIESLQESLSEEPSKELLDATVPEKAQKQRRRLIAWTTIRKGDLFTRDNIAAIRPFGELSASYFGRLMGQSAKGSYEAGDTISAAEVSDGLGYA